MTGNANRNGVWGKGSQKSCFLPLRPEKCQEGNACLKQNVVRKPQIAKGG